MDINYLFLYRRKEQSGKTSLKTFIQKRLIFRLFIACALISVLVASVACILDIHRLGRNVNSRADEFAQRFNNEIQHFLDAPSLEEQTKLRNKLKMLLDVGNLNIEMGHVICAGIYDINGKEIIMEKDLDCDYLNVVDDFMKSLEDRPSEALKKVYKFRLINWIPHIQLTYPLTNSNGEKTAIIEGVFAISSETTNEVVGRILRTAFGVIGIVFLTTVILYPIIITLIGRLSTLADTLLEANIETLQALGSAIAKRDRDTDIHNYRVTIYSVTLAEKLELNRSLICGLIKGAFLHDIGKIGVSDRILLKPGKLTKNEREIMQHHVSHGIDIIGSSDWLKDAMDVVGYHHEKFAGGGYPNGLSGEMIPISARIFAIADVFDALTSSRPYKMPMPFEEAMEILAEGRGDHFDPSLLDSFDSIANSLYEQIANLSDQLLREKLESITRQYFSKEL